jgi:serum/glucocorticoid-regulated kinase 2
LPYIERASSAGYAVLLLRPNTNSITVENAGEAPQKIPIKGSESPEIHALCVWENVVPRAENLNHIALLSYGNGASLCKDLFLREMVSNSEGNTHRIKAFITLEASHIVEKDDAGDIRDALGQIAINMECNPAAKGHRLGYRKDQLGCTSMSLGLPAGMTEVTNVALSVPIAIDSVFKYLTIAESGGNVSKNFAVVMARDNGLDSNTAVVLVNPTPVDELTPLPPAPTTSTKAAPPAPPAKVGFFSKIFGGGAKTPVKASGKNANGGVDDEKLTVTDFDLLKIVGKGAFGKVGDFTFCFQLDLTIYFQVMLVRKKSAQDEGKIYAMKVLKKSVIAAKGQIEHTKSERDILFEVRHPYIVRLRYAFQSDDKLYLVTDYYNGGTLFYHLRKSRHFTEERARFYAAELLSALAHLHEQNIIYRDLKLENVLMDHQGHLALTDFGLSKQNIDSTGGATTFCGTAEYIAPELLKGQKYGPPVDWWSFGILL